MPDGILLTRRELLKRTVFATAGTMAAPMINRGRYRLFAGSPITYSARAIELMKRATVIDMLSPFIISPSMGAKWFSNPDSLTAADLQKFRDSGINIFHIAVGTGERDAHLGTLRFIAAWNNFLSNHDQHLMRLNSPSNLDRVKSSGKAGVLLKRS